MLAPAVATAAAAALVALATAIAPASASAAAPPALSADHSAADIGSAYGAGSFGTWAIDELGLPFYRYDTDELHDPKAQQVELAGSTAAQHQVGNDHIKGMAFNDGYTQFWSQDRLTQWTNLYQPLNEHYSGGYGYLNVGGKVVSTLYLDRPQGAPFERDFGVGYARKRLTAAGVEITQDTYAPYGNDPVLLDDVTLRNTTAAPLKASWFEYWDVNPFDQATGTQRNIGLLPPAWDPAASTLSVQQVTADFGDSSPLSIFAAALSGPVDGHETSVQSFFGSGGRAAPSAVAADHLTAAIGLPSPPGAPGDTLFALRAPVTLAAGQSVTLRYVYGMAHQGQIAGLVSKYRAASDPFASSSRAWAAWVPKSDFGPSNRWVSRELQWDAYMLRSASVYEEACGYHTITQGGYYQYSNGANLGFRSWLHYLLPMVYSDPEMAREILRYSIALQPQGYAQFPYGTGQLCVRVDLGTSNDLDFWLLMAAEEYGLGSRDTRFFDQQLPFYKTGQETSAWEHIKLAFQHQESLLGPHGGYVMGATGDWSDFITQYEQMTESMLVTAQLAYAYPKLAELADLRGDGAFAAQLRAAAARNLTTLRREWTGNGWYSRGYSGSRQVGQGAIFEEPQPWAILAGAPSATQASSLVANIRRFLDGVGAPAAVHGPAPTGSTLTPAYNDPAVTERSGGGSGGAQNNSNYVAGVWFDPNGWLTWALGELDGVVPNARSLAWSEYTRNTLAVHATQYPSHWAGTISIDDTCWGFYSQHPEQCGNGLSTAYDGQITEQPTWMVMDAIRLAGITPTARGFRIAPHLPFARFSLRLPQIGIAAQADRLRGYVTVQQSDALELDVKLPPSVRRGTLRTWAHGHVVKHTVRGGSAVFTLPARAGSAADWAITWTRAATARRRHRRSPHHRGHAHARPRHGSGPRFTG